MIPYKKYHGCGNSFIIFREFDVKNYNYEQLSQNVCNQDIGIGADGCIIIKENPLTMLFYNQDGSKADMCGNGIRCFAKYVNSYIYPNQNQLQVHTGAGVLTIDLEDDQVQVNMGIPSYQHDLLGIPEHIALSSYMIDNYQLHSVYIGTIHTVMFVPSLEDIDIETIGHYICHHPLYQFHTNVNFVEVIDSHNIKVITYERGVGITKACGTGCCASYIYAKQKKNTDELLQVHLPYGTLQIHEKKQHIMMSGPATFVSEGLYKENERIT